MRLTVVVAHPDPGSFNAGIARAVCEAAEGAGATVRLHDLYADGFDPRMPVAEVGTTAFADDLARRYAEEVLDADAIVVVHPVWFFHVPATLKGWVDRVMRDGVVYRVGSGGETQGLLRARAALVVTTANAPQALERDVLGDPLTTFWERIVFGFGGVSDVRSMRFAPVRDSTPEVRTAWLQEVREAVSALVHEASTTRNGADEG